MIIQYYKEICLTRYLIGLFNFYLCVDDIGIIACNECEWIVPGTIDCNIL